MPIVAIIAAIAIVAILIGGTTVSSEAESIPRNDVNDKILVTFSLTDGAADSQRVIADPDVLWSLAQDAAGFQFSFDAFLLAAMVSSEYNGYSASGTLKAAVVWAARNYSERYGRSISNMLIPDGKLGGQKGRYASTRLAPRLYDVLIANGVLDGSISDITGGAFQFDSPRTQDALHARDPSTYKSAQEIAQSRVNDGRTLVLLPGEDPNKIRFWA